MNKVIRKDIGNQAVSDPQSGSVLHQPCDYAPLLPVVPVHGGVHAEGLVQLPVKHALHRLVDPGSHSSLRTSGKMVHLGWCQALELLAKDRI